MEAFPAGDGGFAPTLEDDPALGLTHREKLEILFAVMLGLFLGALDQTIVGPALPTIVTQLSGNDYYVWAITIYLLTSTISVPFWGKLSDLYGRKPIYMIGIVIFLVGSALSGLSQNMGMLILFRGIQGIGAGALFPVALAIIVDIFSPSQRGRKTIAPKNAKAAKKTETMVAEYVRPRHRSSGTIGSLARDSARMNSRVPMMPTRMNPPTVGSAQSPNCLLVRPTNRKTIATVKIAPPMRSKLRVADGVLTVGSNLWITISATIPIGMLT